MESYGTWCYLNDVMSPCSNYTIVWLFLIKWFHIKFHIYISHVSWTFMLFLLCCLNWLNKNPPMVWVIHYIHWCAPTSSNFAIYPSFGPSLRHPKSSVSWSMVIATTGRPNNERSLWMERKTSDKRRVHIATLNGNMTMNHPIKRDSNFSAKAIFFPNES